LIQFTPADRNALLAPAPRLTPPLSQRSHSRERPRSLLRRRHVLAGKRRSGAEEELLHLLHQELLRLRRPRLQAIFVQQHLLPLHPLAPRCLGDVLVNLLAELGIEGGLVQSLHLFLVAYAKNHVRHCLRCPFRLTKSIVSEHRSSERGL
jgi:hypothetical protein